MYKSRKQKKWVIRKALVADAKALSDCMHAAYATYTSRLDGQPLPPLTVSYEEEIRNFPVWIAESEGKLVGGLILQEDDKGIPIANVAVSPDFQGYGLGRGLLNYGEAEARRLGYKEIHLATHILLTENHSLYRHLGWTESNRDEVRVYMKKRLS
jgi:N-acetylglutamate synthase-like GNAT family acetyltransferase